MDDIKLQQMMKTVADDAASRAANIVMEEMQSQFKVYGEVLDPIAQDVKQIKQDISEIKDKLNIHELAIKKAF